VIALRFAYQALFRVKDQAMRTIRSLRRTLFALLLLVLPGCGQKLNYETTVDLDEGQVQSILIDAPKSEQKVTVTVNSAGAPIDAYIVLDKDKEAGKQALLNRQKPPQSLAGKVKTQDATLEATVPANTGFALLVGGASKNSRVSVKVTGR
jgi:hypothetical protein